MTEQQIQSKKIKELEALGYYVLKLIKTNKNGIPDLLALHPDKTIRFIEVKTSKGKVSKLQQYRIDELNGYGFDNRSTQGMITFTSLENNFIDILEGLTYIPVSCMVIFQLRSSRSKIRGPCNYRVF